jgi:hypothetical protein
MSGPPPPQQFSSDGNFSWVGQRRVLWLLVLLMVIAIVLAARSHNTTTDESNAAASPSNSTKSQAPAPGSARAGAKVLLDKTGSGIDNTPSFTTSGDWEIDWSYDCTNFKQSGNFVIFVFNSDGSLSDVAANQHGTKGTDVSNEHQGGTYSLEMDSPCDWHVIVKG